MESKSSFREYLLRLFLAAGLKTASEDADKISGCFQNLLYVLHLDDYSLTSTSHCSDAAAELIRLTAALTSRRITDRFKFGRRYSEEQIRDFCVGRLFGIDVEAVYVLLFDKDEKLISCEHIFDGCVNMAGLMPRKIIDFVSRRGAESIALVHNHPRGVTEPSIDDIKATAHVKHVLRAAEIKFTHSYIVCGFDITDIIDLVSESDDDTDESKPLRVASESLIRNKNKRKV